MTTKTKYPAEVAKAVARELCQILCPCCEPNTAENRPFLVVAGSLRRRKVEVGDLELVFVPAWGEVTNGLLPEQGCLVEHALETLLAKNVLAKRRTATGPETWGPKNKLAVHCATGLPVDFFATKKTFWHNYLVCRTGGAETNKEIATRAQNRGLSWHPYHAGFGIANLAVFLAVLEAESVHLSTGPVRPELLRTGSMIECHSECDVFALAGMDYLEPWERL